MNIALNPMATTNAAGMFNISSAGYIQGIAMDDPSSRNWLAGGIVGPNETFPMWGGVGISETSTPVANSGTYPLGNLGGYITRATNVGVAGTAGSMTGFSVFNQDHAMIAWAQNNVPIAAPGMSCHFYRFGSNARIPVAIDPVLVSLEGGIITQPVSWDFNLQQLVPYVAAYAAATPTVYAYNSATGVLTLTFAANANVVAGDQIALTGMVPSTLNGSWSVNSTSGGGTVVLLQTTPGLGAITPTTGTLVAGGGALPCKVLDIAVGNSMIVNFNGVSGYAGWNYSGNVALIQI